ncbi:MAG TPA: DUF58 domain-containing protein [Planctomycetota bacterium]|nr:DUF58 domain-containing protein [Planctomycetota bacterium]
MALAVRVTAAGTARADARPPRPRVRVSVLGWLILIEGVAMLATVFFQSRPLAAALGAGMLLMVAANLVLAWRRLRPLAATWILPHPVHADEEAAVAALVRAPRGAGPFRLAAPDLEKRAHRVIATIAGADAAGVRATWTMRFPKRGLVVLPPLEARTDQPFGLAEGSRAISPPAELVVLPALGGLRRALRHRLGEWLESAASGLDHGDDELANLRPYRAGDQPRSVHWRASARHRQLLVAERATPLDRTVALVVDVAHAGRRLERLITVAATLVDHLAHHGWRVTLHGAFAAEAVHGDRQVLLETLALARMHAGAVIDYLPPNRAAIVVCSDAVAVPAGAPVFVLPLAQAQEVVRMPGGRRSP